MKVYPPIILVKTWLFVATSTDLKFTQNRFEIIKKINKTFGSIENAYLYVELNEDEAIEVNR